MKTLIIITAALLSTVALSAVAAPTPAAQKITSKKGVATDDLQILAPVKRGHCTCYANVLGHTGSAENGDLKDVTYKLYTKEGKWSDPSWEFTDITDPDECKKLTGTWAKDGYYSTENPPKGDGIKADAKFQTCDIASKAKM